MFHQYKIVLHTITLKRIEPFTIIDNEEDVDDPECAKLLLQYLKQKEGVQ